MCGIPGRHGKDPYLDLFQCGVSHSPVSSLTTDVGTSTLLPSPLSVRQVVISLLIHFMTSTFITLWSVVSLLYLILSPRSWSL